MGTQDSLQARVGTSSTTGPPGLRPLARLSSWRLPISYVQIGVLLTALVVFPFVLRVDPDLWWHLRTGELILHSGIPRHDPYSWTVAGKPWVAHEWLCELLMYIIEAVFGFWANALLFGGMTCAALLLMYRLGRDAGAGTRPLVLLMYLAAYPLALTVTVRPQEVTWLFFAVFVYLIERQYRGRRSPVWLLPPLMALWANLHLGFTYGLMLVVAWVAAVGFDIVRGRAADARTPLLIASTCFFAACLNPHGPETIFYPLRYATDHRITAGVIEWQHANPLVLSEWPIFAADGALVLTLFSSTRPRPFLWVVSTLAIALSLDALRNAPLVSLLLVPVVGAAMSARWGFATRARDSGTRMSAVLAAPLLVAVAFGVAALGLRRGGSVSLLQPSDARYPAGEAAYIQQHYPGERLFNEYGQGGFLIYTLYPTTKVSIDGRGDFYGGQAMANYMTIYHTRPGWQESLAKYDADIVLIQKSAPLAKKLGASGSGWSEVFAGKDDVVFARQLPGRAQ